MKREVKGGTMGTNTVLLLVANQGKDLEPWWTSLKLYNPVRYLPFI